MNFEEIVINSNIQKLFGICIPTCKEEFQTELENNFKKSIRRMRIIHKELEQMGFMGKAGSTEGKVRIFKSQVESHLVKEIKTNSKRLFSYIKQIVKGS